MSTDAQLAAFVDRILRLKAEADDIASDIKEIYQEAHANGYNKTRLGEVVTHIRKHEKDATGEAEKAALRDLYLDAYYRAKNMPHAYARVRGEDYDAETGEITEPQVAPQPVSDLTAPQPLGQVADIQPETSTARIPSVSAADRPNLDDLGTALDPASTVTAFTPKPLRPYCQNPGNGCGGMGRKHCHKCEKARQEAGVA
jgi:uncharacterized protein (UPF0335 family)